MKAQPPFFPKKPPIAHSGFTLLELLVSMSIIAILAAILFPTVTGIMKTVKRDQAKNTAINLKTAVLTYLSEYGKLPFDPARTGDSEVLLPTDADLMDILCASPSEADQGGLNPRRVVFFQDRPAKRMDEGKHRNGILIEANGSAQLFDPWGENYYVSLDGDYNGRVAKPAWDTKTSSYEITDSVLIWSSGPDRDPETITDNIKTW